MASGARRPFHPIAKSSGVISKKILSSVSPPPTARNRRGLSANCTRPVRIVWHGQVDVPGVRKMRDDLRHRIVACLPACLPALLRAPRIRMCRCRLARKCNSFHANWFEWSFGKILNLNTSNNKGRNDNNKDNKDIVSSRKKERS